MRRLQAVTLPALAALLLCACESRVVDVTRPKDVPRVPSPSGWCEAYVAEWSPGTWQVILDFDGGSCGSGAVSASSSDPEFKLRWLDPTTLEVEHARNVQISRNASGEVIQCGGSHRRVRVVLKAN